MQDDPGTTVSHAASGVIVGFGVAVRVGQAHHVPSASPAPQAGTVAVGVSGRGVWVAVGTGEGVAVASTTSSGPAVAVGPPATAGATGGSGGG